MIIKTLTSWFYFIRYEVNFLLGKTFEQNELQMDERYMSMFRMLQQAFKTFDPGERDFITGMYTRRNLIAPADDILKLHAAKWATDVILTIELMHEGKLPPSSFLPVIEPWEIGHYYERLQAYTDWLLSYNPREQKIPMPFFHMVAAERLSKLMKDPVLVAQAPQRVAAKQAAIAMERTEKQAEANEGIPATGTLKPAYAY